LSDEDVTSPQLAERLLQGAVPRSAHYEVTHRTAYRVHERVASGYVKGRMMIAGDAAHVTIRLAAWASTAASMMRSISPLR